MSGKTEMGEGGSPLDGLLFLYEQEASEDGRGEEAKVWKSHRGAGEGFGDSGWGVWSGPRDWGPTIPSPGLKMNRSGGLERSPTLGRD